jgi:hypothetical protein
MNFEDMCFARIDWNIVGPWLADDVSQPCSSVLKREHDAVPIGSLYVGDHEYVKIVDWLIACIC